MESNLRFLPGPGKHYFWYLFAFNHESKLENCLVVHKKCPALLSGMNHGNFAALGESKMDAQLWILQDQTSPQQKIWGLIVADDGSAFTFYGGTYSPRLIVSNVDRKKGLARLTEKQATYQKGWYEKVEIPYGKTPDEFCEIVYGVFFMAGNLDENMSNLLQNHRSKAPDPFQVAAMEKANKRINAAIQKVPSLPWAF
ncbi:hypothetical protein HF670_07660 [Acidithiobacillus thiooxidans]|nr:hypothetical protein [Acidithiobacillus thiooxidans]